MTLDKSEELLLEAASPLGGATVEIYYTPNGLVNADQTLNEYVAEAQDILGGLWQTRLVRTETTVAGVPALRLEGVQTLFETVSHISYYLEAPVGSGDVWSIGLDNDGDQPDPVFETVIETFDFEP